MIHLIVYITCSPLILVEPFNVTCRKSQFFILSVSGLFCCFYFNFHSNVVSGYDVASDLGPHCLPMILLRVSGKDEYTLKKALKRK